MLQCFNTIFKQLGKVTMWRCANHYTYMQLSAELNSAKDAAEFDRVEGFLRAPLAATVWLMFDHEVQF